MGLVATMSVAALAGCGDEPTPVARGAGARDREVEAPADEVALDAGAVAERRAAWVAARPAAYRYEVETTCTCDRSGTFRVTVDGEEVVAVESDDPSAEPYRQYPAPGIDEAFAMLAEPLVLAAEGEIPSGAASAAFDPTYRHPTSFTVTGSGGLGSSHVEIRDFEPLDPAERGQFPVGLEVVVSNQSFGDPDVALTVTVDGEVVIDGSYPVESQHTAVAYLLPLEPGEHQVEIRTDSGATHERTVTVGDQRRYLSISYWGDDATSGEPLSIHESDEPVVMM